MDVLLKFGDCRSDGFRDIRGADFVSNERTNRTKPIAIVRNALKRSRKNGKVSNVRTTQQLWALLFSQQLTHEQTLAIPAIVEIIVWWNPTYSIWLWNNSTLCASGLVLCTVVQYLIAFFAADRKQPSDVVSGMFVGSIVPNKSVEIRDPRSNHSREVSPEAEAVFGTKPF